MAVAREGSGFGFLAGERTHDAHSAEGFGGVGIHVLAREADVAEDGTDAADPGAMGEPDCWKEDDRSEQQFPIDEGEDNEASEQLDDGSEGIVDHGEDEVGDAAGVFAEDGCDAAGFQVVDAVEGKTDGVIEDGFSDGDLDALGHARGLPAAPEPDDFGCGGQHDHADCHDHQELMGVMRQVNPLRHLGREGPLAEDAVEDDLGAVEGEETQQC